MPDAPPSNPALDEATVQKVHDLLSEGRMRDLAALLNALHPSDAADLLGRFDHDDQFRLFSLLDRKRAADVLVELDRDDREELIDRLRPDMLRGTLAEMEPDEAADVLGEMEPEEAAQALAGLEDRRDIEQLLQYPPDTAGGLMTTEFVTLPETATVREALARARGASETTHRNYLYATDAQGRLVGRVPLIKLVVSPPETPIRDIMETDVHGVPADTDREEVADIVRRYDLLAVPVIDPQTRRVVGVITFDDAFDAADEEAAEDMFRLAGTGTDDPLHQPIWKRAVLRLPWLLITLLPGFLVGQIMRWLGYDPGGTTALLLFVPVMIEMAGNVSLQSSTVMVRGLATGELRGRRLTSILGNEVAVALLVGLACGTVSGLVGYIFFGHHIGFAVVVGFSMLCGILSAAVTGTFIPLGCDRVGVDPALASGPFVTSLNDITGTLIYLGLGARLLRFFAE